MPILKQISESRLEYRKKHGRFPKFLVTDSPTLELIKARLYKGTNINLKDVPLSKYDQMEILVDDASEGWRFRE